MVLDDSKGAVQQALGYDQVCVPRPLTLGIMWSQGADLRSLGANSAGIGPKGHRSRETRSLTTWATVRYTSAVPGHVQSQVTEHLDQLMGQ